MIAASVRRIELPNGQVVEAPVLEIARGLELTGERFGMLTAIRVVSKSEAGNVWLCQCDCGGFALRAARYLTRTKRDGIEAQCLRCLRELNTGRAIEFRQIITKVRAQQLKLTGSLYTELWEKNELRALRGELGIVVDEPQPLHFGVEDYGQLDWSGHECNDVTGEPEERVMAVAQNEAARKSGSWDAHPKRLRNAELVWCPQDGITWPVGCGAEQGATYYEHRSTSWSVWPEGRAAQT